MFTQDSSSSPHSLGSLIRQFTYNGHLYPREYLDSLEGRTCFRRVRFGFDYTYTPKGYAYSHPRNDSVMVFNKFGEDSEVYEPSMNAMGLEIMRRRLEIIPLLHSKFDFISSQDHTAARSKMVLIVDRKHNRRIINVEELKVISDHLIGNDSDSKSSIAYLEDSTFIDHVKMFSESSIVVFVTGAGGSNLVFLPRGSVIILLMVPSVVGQKWLYANEALALGHHVIVWWDQSSISDSNYRWNPQSDDSHIMKGADNDDVYCDPTSFETMMHKAVDLLENHGDDVIPSYFLYPRLYQ